MKDDSISHSSTKDSAYGSMEVKVNSTSKAISKPDNKARSLTSSTHNSPSRSLSATSINQPQNSSTVSTHVQRIQRSEEVFSKELESLKGSSSTLHSLANSSRSNSTKATRNGSLECQSNEEQTHIDRNGSPNPNIPRVTQNGISEASKNSRSNRPSYVSMKSTVYDNVTIRSEASITSELIPYNNQPNSPYTSMVNLVQGQMKINPHGNEIDKNTINVSVTSVNRNKK